MNDVLAYINRVPEGCLVVIHLDCGSTQWNADKSVNQLLVGRIGHHKVERTMVTTAADGKEVYHIFPEDARHWFTWGAY